MCKSDIGSKYRLEHDQKIKKKKQEWYQSSSERMRASALRNRRQRREEVLGYYGGSPPKCACCGENRFQFLCIDHIHGGGTEHKKQINKDLYLWLKMRGFPEGFRVLCHNCNMSLGMYGFCPHDQEREKAA